MDRKKESMGKISNIYAALLKTIYIKKFNMNAFSSQLLDFRKNSKMFCYKIGTAFRLWLVPGSYKLYFILP